MNTNTKISRGLPSSRHLHNPAVRRMNRRQRDAVMLRLGMQLAEQRMREERVQQTPAAQARKVPWSTKARMWLRRKTGIRW